MSSRRRSACSRSRPSPWARAPTTPPRRPPLHPRRPMRCGGCARSSPARRRSSAPSALDLDDAREAGKESAVVRVSGFVQVDLDSPQSVVPDRDQRLERDAPQSGSLHPPTWPSPGRRRPRARLRRARDRRKYDERAPGPPDRRRGLGPHPGPGGRSALRRPAVVDRDRGSPCGSRSATRCRSRTGSALPRARHGLASALSWASSIWACA